MPTSGSLRKNSGVVSAPPPMKVAGRRRSWWLTRHTELVTAQSSSSPTIVQLYVHGEVADNGAAGPLYTAAQARHCCRSEIRLAGTRLCGPGCGPCEVGTEVGLDSVYLITRIWARSK